MASPGLDWIGSDRFGFGFGLGLESGFSFGFKPRNTALNCCIYNFRSGLRGIGIGPVGPRV